MTASSSITDRENGNAAEKTADPSAPKKDVESKAGPIKSKTDAKELAVYAKAEAYFKKHPNDRKKTILYGAGLVKKGEYQRAIEFYKERLSARPDDADFLYGLGWACEQSKQWAEATTAYGQACEANSRHLGALNNLSWVLSTAPDESIRDGKRAVKLAKQAMRLAGERAHFVADTLAAAYAENGEFKPAIKLQQQLIKQAPSERRKELRARLELYEQGQPFRSN